ncbi:MAG TPA: outer membrane lipoprotein carrier protein LolA [Pseudonocardiaceae bacterium]|jgi:outer membrane lipoprotein-sorting protein
MDRRKATLGGAGIGVVAGVVGLVVLATPAGAGPAPSLPATTPQALVQSVLTASVPSMSGTIAVQNNLGLPAVPGIPELANGTSQVRVWSDGTGRSRVSVPTATSEQTFVDDGKTLYSWDSSGRTVTEAPTAKSGKSSHQPAADAPTDPATMAKELVGALQNSSNITVDGTDTVAGQPAYDLVLTPKPSQRTLLREVKIAVDANKHIPLQLTVLGDNSDTPAVQVGFASLDYGPQQSSLFTFTPPAGATVTQENKSERGMAQHDATKLTPKIVGSGWDTVAILTLPSGTNSDGQGATQGKDGMSSNPLSLAREFGTPVSGSWGSGWAIGTNVGTAVLTSDGRVAIGLVPQQVLTEALGSK